MLVIFKLKKIIKIHIIFIKEICSHSYKNILIGIYIRLLMQYHL